MNKETEKEKEMKRDVVDAYLGTDLCTGASGVKSRLIPGILRHYICPTTYFCIDFEFQEYGVG